MTPFPTQPARIHWFLLRNRWSNVGSSPPSAGSPPSFCAGDTCIVLDRSSLVIVSSLWIETS